MAVGLNNSLFVASAVTLQINSYGNTWPYNVDGGTRVLIGLIHQLK